MADEGFKRKLTAILSADVAGYSRLMAEDETSTVKTIATYREVIASLIKQHRGRVVDSPGDNVLSEFSSVVDAVQCAVAVQNEIQARNAELPDKRKMEFRIGVNLGDVIDEEDRIYGDGVNIAARLEAMADPGGICVSKMAFDQIETKLPLGYEYLGEQVVKNIPKPVKAYRVLMKPDAAGKVIGEKRFLGRFSRKTAIASIIVLLMVAGGLVGWNIYLQQSKKVEPASVDKMAFPLPDKPSIAVLPFDSLSKDQSDAYIADGLSENIISSLSKIPHLMVVARNSTFFYKGKAVKVNQVAEELGVRYVLEGSVQKSEDKIRVIAQLIDAVSGHHLWSERYDREIKDFFQILDEITIKIVDALRTKMVSGGDVLSMRSTSSFEAWSYYIKGVRHFERFTKQDNIRTRELVKKAIELDPKYVRAWTMLGWTHFSDTRNRFTDTPLESIKQGVLSAQRASAIDDRDPNLQNLWASLYLIQRQHEKAITAGKKAIELDVNNADAHALLAQIMYYSGKPDEAIILSKQAMRLAPYPPAYYLIFLGWGYQGAGRYQEALSVFQKFLDRAQAGEISLIFAHYNMTTSYSLMGNYEKAREHWAEVLKIYPNASLKWVSSIHFFKDPDQLERLLDVLRAAGIE
jgi:adenylate cyclase